MNETLQAIFDRRSIRDFQQEPLSGEQIQLLARAALASPSGMNLQPWHFSFVTRKSLIGKISDAAFETFRRKGQQDIIDRMSARHEQLFYGAPLVVFITMNKDNRSEIDAGIAAENLAIAAQSLGLGSCIIGLAAAAFQGESADELKKRLEFPRCHEMVISVAIGHPAVHPDPHDMHPEKISFIG